MRKSLGVRRLYALVALVALATGLAGCRHLPAAPVPQATAGAPGIVVFDVDGTLTPTVARILSVRPEASAVARLYAGRGHRIVYLTARAPALQGHAARVPVRQRIPAG